MNNAVLVQIAALPKMPMAALKNKWRDLYNADPPPAFNRAYIVSKLAYRLQELAWGSDGALLNKRLEAMARSKLGASGRDELRTRVQRPLAGTKLIREYRGIEYHITVLADGFAYEGRKYHSLSRIAQIITGSPWSGPAFFGLVERKIKRS
ncbi:MAG: DUF2924 domain-containing protein [Alphaproteobacteria bacterium]|nr:DUF2924 domain-containing protein [Alphaproteobacteria bacterium]